MYLAEYASDAPSLRFLRGAPKTEARRKTEEVDAYFDTFFFVEALRGV